MKLISLKVFKIYFQKNHKKLKTETKQNRTKNSTKKNDTNAKHPQMITYKIIVVSAEEAKSGGRTKR